MNLQRLISELEETENDSTTEWTRAQVSRAASLCGSFAPVIRDICCYEQWLAEDVYFTEGREVQLHHLYRALDLLDRHKDEIEEAVYWRIGDLLNLDADLIFYDTTSVYFEIDKEDYLKRRGHSKDGKGDRPQIVVGLAVTRDGIPVKSWVFPGNAADVSTIEHVKNDLRGWKLNRCIFCYRCRNKQRGESSYSLHGRRSLHHGHVLHHRFRGG